MARSATARMSENWTKVFVYGTLKRGEPNHHWLTNVENGCSKFISAAKTTEKFPLVVGTRYNIPFLLDKRGVGHHICGEVYEVDELMLSKLDVLEDYPNYYDREKQNFTTTTDETLECWVYLLRKFPPELLNKEHLSSYTNTPEQPYKEVYERDTSAREDLDH